MKPRVKKLNESIIKLIMLSRFSRVQLFVTLRTIARQAPLSVGFSRQEYWSGLPCSPPGDLPDLGIEPASHVFYIGRWVLNHQCHLQRPKAQRMGQKASIASLVSPVNKGGSKAGNKGSLVRRMFGELQYRCQNKE